MMEFKSILDSSHRQAFNSIRERTRERQADRARIDRKRTDFTVVEQGRTINGSVKPAIQA